MSEEKEMTFDLWFGENRYIQPRFDWMSKPAAEIAWNFQQKRIDALKSENERIKKQLEIAKHSIERASKTRGHNYMEIRFVENAKEALKQINELEKSGG